MDIDLITIFVFVMLIASLAFSMAHKFHRRTVEHEERKLELEAQIARAKSGGDSDKVRKLEERVRVLERIATDSNHALASQIENLRDLHELDAIEHKQEAAQ